MTTKATQLNPACFRLCFHLLFFFYVLLAGIPAVMAAAPEKTGRAATPPPPLKISYNEFMPFFFTGHNRQPRGILVDVWQLWSKKTGIPIQFNKSVRDMSANDGIPDKADINGLMFKTLEQEKIFEFTPPLFDLTSFIYFRSDLAVPPKKLPDLRTLKIGAVAGDFSLDFLTRHLHGNPPLTYPDHEQLVRAALDGKVQAFLMEGPVASTYLAKYDGLHTIRHLAHPAYKLPLYAGVRTGKSTLLDQINQGLSKITSREIEQIIKNWTGEGRDLVWQPFTGTVKIVASIDNMPFHFADDSNRAVGMFIDLWRLWSRKTGIKIEFSTAPWAKSLDMVKNGQADIHAGCFFSVKRDKFLDYAGILRNTQTHFFFHESIFGLKNLQDLTGFEIGVLDQDYAVEFVNRKLPDAALKKYNSHRDLFKGVVNGEIKVFICDTPTALYFLKKENLLTTFNYHPARPLYRKPFYAAVRQGNAPLLRQVNKGLAAITQEEKSAIERKWTAPAQSRPKDVLVIAAAQDFPPFSFLGAEGNPSGFFIDLWKMWSQKTGKPVTFKLYHRLDAIHALKDGIADVLSTLPPKNRVEGWGDLSAVYYRFNWYLYETPGKSLYNPPILKPGQTLGVVSGTRAWEWASIRNPPLKTKTFYTAKDMLLAAAAKQIPAFLALPQEIAVLPGQLGIPSDFKISEEPLVHHPVGAWVRSHNPGLVQTLSNGFSRISNAELTALENRWIAKTDARLFSSENEMIRFSNDESKWLMHHRRNGKKIRLGVRADFPPFEFIDEDDAFLGMVSDYVKILNQRLGIHMVVSNKIRLSAIGRNAAQAFKKIDVFPSAASFEAPSARLDYTTPYLSFPWVIVNRHQAPLIGGLRDLNGKTVAVIDWYEIREKIAKDHPQVSILPVHSAEQGLQAVRKNKAEAYVGNLAVVGYQLKEKNDTGLKVAAATEYADAVLKFAVRDDWPEFTRILNKGLLTISAQEHDRIRQKWFSVRFEHGVDEKSLRTLVLRAGIAGLIIFGLILFWHLQIRRREERFRCLTEHGTDIIQAFSTEGIITYQSPSFTSILGYKPQSLIGTSVFDLLNPSEKSSWKKMIRRMTRQKEDKSAIHRLKHADGHYLFFESIFSNLTRNKALNAIVMNGREITERLNAEYEMQQAKELAENANLTKSDFLASLSHEIRTPLNAILGMTDVTLKTPLNEQQEKNLTTVKYSARHLLDVITDILDFSTIEAGKMRFQQTAFSLKDLLADIELTWGFQARQKGLRFDLNMEKETPAYLFSDPVRLRQIIGNLLSNAVKFTHEGRITLSTRLQPDPGRQAFSLLFTVKDTGIGIEPDRLDLIFERFTQAQASITREYGGTGLGLAICREVSKLMGGTLHVDSRPGQGSRFTLTLPFNQADCPDKLPGKNSADPDLTGGERVLDTQQPPLTLLLVEDDRMNVRVFKAFLEQTRHSVLYAPDGLSAISLLKQHRIDLVFMDIEMPGLDGLTTCQRIRNGEAGTAHTSVPVIAMTAHVLDEFKEKSRDAGMNDFIAKPVDMDRLFTIIGKYRPARAPDPVSTAGPLPDSSLYDYDKALAALGGNPALLKSICRIFVDQTPGQLADLKTAMDRGDMEAVRILAHTLKGSASRIFADGCRDLAARLERSARQAPVDVAKAEIQELTLAFNRLMGVLEPRSKDTGP